MTFEWSKCNVKMRWGRLLTKIMHTASIESMTTIYVAENTVSLKVGRRLYLLWRHTSVNWTKPAISAKSYPKGCHISCATIQRDPSSGSVAIPENSWVVAPPSTWLGREGWGTETFMGAERGGWGCVSTSQVKSFGVEVRTTIVIHNIFPACIYFSYSSTSSKFRDRHPRTHEM